MKSQNLLWSLTVAISVCFIAGATEVLQTELGNVPVVDRPQRAPDESILWRLFHAKKYKQLTLQIDQLREQFPGWRPPNDLLIALLGLQHSGKLTAKSPRSQHSTAAIKKIYSSRKSSLGAVNSCNNLQARWNWAEYQLKRNRTEKALAIYKHIVVQCPAKHKMETLEKVRADLDYGDYVDLLATGNDFLPTFYLDRLKYEALKDHYVRDSQPLSAEQNERIVTEATYFLELFKDGDFATAIGWRYFDMKDYKKSQDWFQKAVTWNPANENAQYGRSLSLEKAGEYDKALAAYSATKNPSQETQAGAKRLLKAKAWKNLDSKNLPQAAENVAQAEKLNGADPEITELNAWIAKENDQNEKAAKLFEDLYHQTLSRKYARAYVESQAKIDRSELADKAEQKDGVLLEEYQQYHGKELYERKQFQSAYKLTPKTYPKLENIDSPSVDIGGYVRYKSGEEGLGRLDLFKAPIATGSYTVDGIHNFKVGLSRVQLYSGSPGKCNAPIGSLRPDGRLGLFDPAGSDCSQLNTPFSPTKQLNNALEIDFAYRKDGWFSPFVKVGTTPIDGVIDPTITYDVGFIQQAEFGNWGLEVYSQPVRQSILSYTGIKDPYGLSPDWGRVVRTGIRPSIFYRFNDDWNASGAVELALLEGKNVQQNKAIAVSAALGRNFDLPGFDYITVGPSFNYEHFDKNLSHFTYGHGGYFSPEHYINVGAGVNFLTEEGKPYVIKGRFIAGFQDIKEARVPWFPLDNRAGGFYDAAGQNGEALDFELKGVWLVHPNFQVGAGGAVRKTNGFEDYTGGLFVRLFFDDRKASFSTDIPDNMFSTMY